MSIKETAVLIIPIFSYKCSTLIGGSELFEWCHFEVEIEATFLRKIGRLEKNIDRFIKKKYLTLLLWSL